MCIKPNLDAAYFFNSVINLALASQLATEKCCNIPGGFQIRKIYTALD